MDSTDKSVKSKYQHGALMMSIATAFLTTFVGSGLNLSVPLIESEYATNAVTVGWVVTGYTMAAAVFSVPFGKLADVIGRRKVLIAGLTGFIASSLICLVAKSVWVLILLRVLNGIAAACLFATNNAILISVFPGNMRGAVLGISVASTYTGLSVGPVIGGILTSNFGWRSILLCATLIGAVALYYAFWGCPPDDEYSLESKVDVAGNVLYLFLVATFLLGFSNIINGYKGIVLLGVFAVLAVLFVRTENRAENPVIRISMFTRDSVFTLSNIAALLNYAATFAVTYLVSIYFQVVMGFSPQKAGLILVCMPAMQAIFASRMGRLSDRVPPYKLATAGMGLCVIALGGFACLGTDTPLGFAMISLVIMGFGFSLFSSPNTNAIMSRVNKEEYAVANSIVSTMRTVGQSISMALVNIIVSIRLGQQALSETAPRELIGTMRLCFIVFVVMCVIGTIISMNRGEKRA